MNTAIVDRSIPVSVLITTKNEQSNIASAIGSVAWAQEVFVVDSNSEDRTCAIAEELGAKVVQFEYTGGWPKKRNWALLNLEFTTDWILILDADERVTEELAISIKEAVDSNSHNGYYLLWKFMFLGRWMKHSWSHGWMLRLIRKGSGEYEDLGMRGEGGWDNEVHENIIVSGSTAKLSGYLLHESNEDLSFWIKKQNEFSTWNAKRRATSQHSNDNIYKAFFSSDPVVKRKLLKSIFLKLPFKSVLVFFWLYIVRLGVMDGRAGFYFCALRAIHEFNIGAKIFELNMNADNPISTEQK